MAAVVRIAIVGAGLAGLASAVAAARAGAQVQLFEAQPQLQAPAAHIDLVPNLLRDLAALGLGEACVRRGFPYRDRLLLDGDGRRCDVLPLPQLAGPKWPAAVGLTYGELLALLHAAALAQGVQVHLGRPVQDACDDGALLCADGSRHAADLVVLACGRQLPTLGGQPLAPVPLAHLPQHWCHTLLPRPAGLDDAAWVMGHAAPALQAVLVPVDALRVGLAVLQAPGMPVTAAALREGLAAQGRLLRSLAEHCHDGLPVVRRAVCSGVLPGAWFSGRVLRIGQAAHHLPPHFGQAAAQAVEDACVLGSLLQARLAAAALLDGFMARRGKRARQVLAVTSQAARWQLQPEAATDLRALSRELQPLVAEPA